MEEQNQSNEMIQSEEPEMSDNSNIESDSKAEIFNSKEGKSQDPSELILGKFKSTEDLTKAYQELEKLQGNQSAELGHLRGNVSQINNIQNVWSSLTNLQNQEQELKEIANKYNTYFQDPSFREMYKSAYLAMGSNLDTDAFINLLEGYVSARIFNHDRENSKLKETQKLINEMTFDKNEKTSSQNEVKKRVEDMSPKEYEEFLQRLI